MRACLGVCVCVSARVSRCVCLGVCVLSRCACVCVCARMHM